MKQISLQGVEDLPSNESLQTTDYNPLGEPVTRPSLHVDLGPRVEAESSHRYQVEGLVRLAVSSSVQAHRIRLATTRWVLVPRRRAVRTHRRSKDDQGFGPR